MTALVVRDRILACRLLAGALDDLTLGPSTWRKNPLNYRHEPGRPAPSVKEICLTCDGDKITRDKYGRSQTCADCEGRGWHLIDPMIQKDARAWNEPAASAFTRRHLCPRCGGEGVWKSERCTDCNGSGAITVPIDPGPQEPPLTDVVTFLEHAIERRDQEGDFHALELALTVLRQRSPHRYRVYWHVAVRRRPIADLSERETRWLAEADRDLEAMMPAEIRVPGYLLSARKAVREQLRSVNGRVTDVRVLQQRNEAIRAAYNSGEMTAAQLMRTYNLRKSQLYEVLYEVRSA